MRFCFLNSENWALTFPVGNQMPAAAFTPFSRRDAESLTHAPPTPPPAPKDLWTITVEESPGKGPYKAPLFEAHSLQSPTRVMSCLSRRTTTFHFKLHLTFKKTMCFDKN